MAFNLQNYVQGNFKVGNDLASIKEAAQAIVDNASVFGSVGNQAPVTWAKQALVYLKEIEGKESEMTYPSSSDPNRNKWEAAKDARNTAQRAVSAARKAGNLTPAIQATYDAAVQKEQSYMVPASKKATEEAYRWITGTAQASAAKNYKEKYVKRVADLKKDIANKASNIANVLDIPANMPAAEAARARARAATMQAELSALSPQAQALGVDIPASSGLVKTAGGYIPASEATAAQRAQQQEADAYAAAGTTPPTSIGGVSIQMQGFTSPEESMADAAKIPFKAGFTGNKQSIIDLVQKKLPGEWNATDKANWAYATGGAVIPSSVTMGAQQFNWSAIQWKPGITDAQKQEFQALAGRKPVSDWNSTDRANWSYATNNAPLPSIQAASSTDTSGGTGSSPDVLPPEIQELMQGLSQDQQDLIALTYNSLVSGDAAFKADAAKALQDATDLADPYFKEQIRMVQDELGRSVSNTSEDAASSVAQQQKHIEDLQRDLAFNRESLTLEEQASLASQLREYQTNLRGLQQDYAEAGLAFSSPRSVAEQELGQKQRDVAESTTRQTQRSLYALQSGTDSAIADAQAGITNTQRTAAYNTTSTARKAEGMLGTKNTPAVTGVTPLGGITGSIDQNRQAAIVGLENTLLARTAPQKFF